jgi:hypothetical protein
MTYQPPPPPPPGPGGPPPGQWGGPARPGFDPKTVNPLDWGILGIGALMLIFSFFGYYSWSYEGFGVSYSASLSAWHFGGGTFVAWFAMIIGVLAAVVVALGLFLPTLNLPIPFRIAALGLFGISFLLYVIAIFAHEDFGPGGGHGFSFWISLIFAAAGAVLALMRVQQTGGQLPGPLAGLPNIGAKAPGGSPTGQPPAGPPPGYAPPPPPPGQ